MTVDIIIDTIQILMVIGFSAWAVLRVSRDVTKLEKRVEELEKHEL